MHFLLIHDDHSELVVDSGWTKICTNIKNMHIFSPTASNIKIVQVSAASMRLLI